MPSIAERVAARYLTARTYVVQRPVGKGALLEDFGEYNLGHAAKLLKKWPSKQVTFVRGKGRWGVDGERLTVPDRFWDWVRSALYVTDETEGATEISVTFR